MKELVRKNASSLGYTINKEQLDVVQFLQGRDVFAILPTGFGKSLCFACLPGAFNHLRCIKDDNLHKSIIIVVSPLVAIMTDQVANFTRMGLKVACVCGEMKDITVSRDIKEGKYELVIFSPKSLFTNKWRKIVQSDVWLKNFVGFEVHCMQKW